MSSAIVAIEGKALKLQDLKKGEPYIRITLAAPVNVGIYPGDDPVNKTKWYKEWNVRYIDAPADDYWKSWYNKTEHFNVGSKKGCKLFIPASNIAGVNIRSSYPIWLSRALRRLLRATTFLYIMFGGAVIGGIQIIVGLVIK